MKKSSLFVTRVAVLSSFAAIGSCRTTRDPALKDLLQKGVDRGYPAVAMLIQTANGTIRAAATGHSDLERLTPVNVDDAFQMASITKTFTAVAALRLIDEGKLSLNARLGDLLGEAVGRIPSSERITVAQLLDHSSGIYATNNDMDYLTTVIGPKADPRRVWSPAEIVALADRDRSKPSGIPGEGHFYSDTNYVILGMIVERISGLPLKEHIAKTLLKPLGMRSTYFYSDYLGKNARPPSRTVQGYLLATDELRSAISINPMFKAVPGHKTKEGILLNTTLAAERLDAAAGLVTTLPDLLKFATSLFGGKLLSPRSQEFIMSAGKGMGSQPIGTKRIWTLQAIREPYGVLVYKEGDGPGGVNTLMAYQPATGDIYIGFVNCFGYFNEVDFLMDEVIGGLARNNSSPQKTPRRD